MKFKERLEKFLELQNRNMSFDDISKELEISSSTLRTFLNKRGYKWNAGRYVLKEEKREEVSSKGDLKQIEFREIETKSNNTNKNKMETKIKKDLITKSITNSNKKNATNKNEDKKNNSNKIKVVKKDDSTESTSKTSKVTTKKSSINKIESKKDANTNTKTKAKPKKDRKINLSQEDLDKLCEVYDWYLEVKDNKAIKPKSNNSNKKDIIVEQTNINDLKSTNIRVDKKVWEDFERLCSNSQYTKQEIITQALKDFMKEYKNLL